MKKSLSFSSILTVALTGVLITFVVLQFTPYFYNPDGQPVSLASYIWFITNHGAVTEHILLHAYGFNVNSILVIGMFLPLAATALIYLVLKFDRTVTAILASAWGVWGLAGFLSNPALRLGGTTFTLILVMFIGVIALSTARVLCKDARNRVQTVHIPLERLHS